jgi:adenine deaminase
MSKHTYSRRGFIGLTGAGIAGVAGGAWLPAAWAAETQDPDLVVFNAKVYTVDSGMPKAEAFAVRNSRFVAVGSSEEIRGLAGKSTRRVDAQQMTIVPGFIDWP